MRFIVTSIFLLASFVAQAQPSLLLSHVQHFYAGGGGCAERFWLEWQNSNAEITGIEIQIEVQSEGEEAMTQTLSIARLGTAVSDRTSETLLETPSCLSGHPNIVVRKASATLSGRSVDLLQNDLLRAGKVERYPLTISSPSQRSNRPH